MTNSTTRNTKPLPLRIQVLRDDLIAGLGMTWDVATMTACRMDTQRRLEAKRSNR
jgi:hypothetical protein